MLELICDVCSDKHQTNINNLNYLNDNDLECKMYDGIMTMIQTEKRFFYQQAN
jgi:hypothetical protein